MLPEFPNFKQIELSDKSDIETITSKYPPYSDFNFVSMWSWDVKGEMRISQLYGNLVARFTDYITGEPIKLTKLTICYMMQVIKIVH